MDLEVVIADTDYHDTHIENDEQDPFGEAESEHEEFDKPYVPVKEDPTVHKTIEILNGLCKKYKYAVFTRHIVVDERSLHFFIDYHANGKEVCGLSFELDKKTSGRWVCRCYLSVIRATRIPLTNITSLVSDFKNLIQTLHIDSTDKPKIEQ
jgi:hypothetical protein